MQTANESMNLNPNSHIYRQARGGVYPSQTTGRPSSIVSKRQTPNKNTPIIITNTLSNRTQTEPNLTKPKPNQIFPPIPMNVRIHKQHTK